MEEQRRANHDGATEPGHKMEGGQNKACCGPQCGGKEVVQGTTVMHILQRCKPFGPLARLIFLTHQNTSKIVLGIFIDSVAKLVHFATLDILHFGAP